MVIDRNKELAEGEYLGLYSFEGCQILAVLSGHMTYGRARAAWVRALGDATRYAHPKPTWWPTNTDTVRMFDLDDARWRDVASRLWCPGTYARINADAADWAAYIPQPGDVEANHGHTPTKEIEGCDVLACTAVGDVLATVDGPSRLSSVQVAPHGVRFTYSAQVLPEGLLLSKAQGFAQVLNRRRIALVAPLAASVRDVVYAMAGADAVPESVPESVPVPVSKDDA